MHSYKVTIGKVFYGGNAVLNRLKTRLAAVGNGMGDGKVAVFAHVNPHLLMFLGKNNNYRCPRLVKFLDGAHEHRLAVEWQKLLGHLTAKALAAPPSHYYRISLAHNTSYYVYHCKINKKITRGQISFLFLLK